MASKKLTVTDIENLIDSVHYLTHRTLTVCVLTLTNGAMVTGESNVIDPANYDQQVGREMAYRDAFGKIWQLEGYAVKREGAEEQLQHAAAAGVASEIEDALGVLADLGQSYDCADAMAYAFSSMRADDGCAGECGGETESARDPEPRAVERSVVRDLLFKARDAASPQLAAEWATAAEHAARALEALDRTDPDW